MIDVGWRVQVLVIGLLGPLTPGSSPGQALALSHGGERGHSFGCRSIAASLYWVRAGDNWLFFSHTKYSVADVARPSVFRTVAGRCTARSQSIFVSHRCCSLGRSTKRSDVCRVKRGFARTLNGGSAPEVWRVPPPHVAVHPLRAPFVLRTFPPRAGANRKGRRGRECPSVWLASRSRLPAPHPSPGVTIPQWPGCRSALRSNLSSTSGGHRRGSLGQASDAYTIHVSSLPQTGVSLFDCRYPCVKGALALDAAILLGAGADGRLLLALGCYCGTCVVALSSAVGEIRRNILTGVVARCLRRHFASPSPSALPRGAGEGVVFLAGTYAALVPLALR